MTATGAKSKIAILGAGSWGLTIANLLASNSHAVHVWEFDQHVAQRLAKTRKLREKLPGILIDPGIEITSNLQDSLQGISACVFAVPSVHLRSVAERSSALGLPPHVLVVSLTKGLESGTNKRMTELVAAEWGRENGQKVVALSGPSHAEEVARGVPTAVVAASTDLASAHRTVELFANAEFRVYVSEDPIGVELGGALKNVVAIAAGILDGLGYPSTDNVKSALMTRGLAEITRAGLKMGALPETFAGLSGIGDLIATCTSKHSRNRYVGEKIGRGETLDNVLKGMTMVAEGVPATRAAVELARKLDVEMPIANEVHHVLFDGKSPREAIVDLMNRTPKSEVWN